jgi:hypothetical protein
MRLLPIHERGISILETIAIVAAILWAIADFIIVLIDTRL